jgi:hypothetical protein
VSRSLIVTFGCCLCAAVLAVVGQADDPVPWTAYFATAVLVITTALVAIAVLRMLGRSEDDADERTDTPAAVPTRARRRRRSGGLPDRRLRS